MNWKKMIVFTLFVAAVVSFLGEYSFSHEPCMSEKAKVDAAEKAYDDAQKEVNRLIGEINEKTRHMAMDTHNGFPHTQAQIRTHFNERETLRSQCSSAETTRDNKKTAYDIAVDRHNSCKDSAFRKCPMNCEVEHTKNVTSCECNCEYSRSQGCACGPCSSSLNNN